MGPFLLALLDAGALPQYVFNGLVVGAVLALAAMGLTLVYGILDLSNFAHGDLLTLGAYLTIFFTAMAAPAVTHAWAVALVLAAAAVFLLARRRRFGLGRMDAGVVLVGGLLFVAALAGGRFVPRLDGALVVGGAAAAAALAAGAVWTWKRRPDPAWQAGAAAALVVFVLLAAGRERFVLPALVAAAVVGLGSVVLDLAVWQPLRRRRATVLTLLIVSIGVALALRHALMVRFGTGFRNFDRPLAVAEEYYGVLVTPEQTFVLVAAVLLVACTHVVLRRTRLGRAMRALADDRDLARASGIDVDRVVRHVWLLAGALAGIAGVLLGMLVNVHPNLGWFQLLPVFAAVILGGIGSPTGAMVGGVALGVVMETSVAFAPEYKLAMAFLVLIAVLVVRPEGIFGGRTA